MENELISDISAVERDIETFLLHSGFVGPDGILNESCYPQRKYFTHESYAGSPGSRTKAGTAAKATAATPMR